MLLRDARAVLRRVDVLMAAAAATDDPTPANIAALRSDTERLAGPARKQSAAPRA
jgi:hypothetical protein